MKTGVEENGVAS